MAVVNLTDQIMQINLPGEPQACSELQQLNEKVCEKCDSNIIIDFSQIEIITSASISNLLILHNCPQENGRKLVLYRVRVSAKCIFRVAGLDSFFNFAPDKASAMSTL